MKREGAVGPGGVEQPVGDHLARAVVALLTRLEHEDDRARQLVAPGGQRLGRADQHGGVRVVAAGVHGAGDGRRVVQPGRLRHRERIVVAAQQHGAPVAAGLTVQHGHEARRPRALMEGERQAGERGLHLGGRLGTVQADLRLRVDGAAQRHRVGQLRLADGGPVGGGLVGHGHLFFYLRV